MQEQRQTKNVRVHHCRFVDVHPEPISCIRFSYDGSYLAVAREEGRIDIYDVKSNFCLVHQLLTEDCSPLSSITWGPVTNAGPVIFGVGMAGLVFAWSFSNNLPLFTEAVSGSAILAMDYHVETQTLVVGMADGTVHFYTVDSVSAQIQLVHSRAGMATRVTSLIFKHDKLGIAYADGRLTVISRTSNGQGWSTEASTVYRVEKGAGKPICWSCMPLPGTRFATSDNHGNITVWQDGTPVFNIARHTADVLALAATPDASMIIGAGADPAVVALTGTSAVSTHASGSGEAGAEAGISAAAPPPYAFSSVRRPHSHDVRSIAVSPAPGVLFPAKGARPTLLAATGGVDGTLCIHSVQEMVGQQMPRVLRISPGSQRPGSISVSPGSVATRSARTVAYAGPGGAEVAALPGPDDSVAGAQPEAIIKLADLPEGVLAMAISPDGIWLAISNARATRLLQLEWDAEVGFTRARVLPTVLPVATALSFVPDGTLLAGTAGGVVYQVQPDPVKPKVLGSWTPFVREEGALSVARPVSFVTGDVHGHVIALSTLGCEMVMIYKGILVQRIRSERATAPVAAVCLPTGVLVLQASPGAIGFYNAAEGCWAEQTKDSVAAARGLPWISISECDGVVLAASAEAVVSIRVSDSSFYTRGKRRRGVRVLGAFWQEEDEMTLLESVPSEVLRRLPAAVQVPTFGDKL